MGGAYQVAKPAVEADARNNGRSALTEHDSRALERASLTVRSQHHLQLTCNYYGMHRLRYRLVTVDRITDTNQDYGSHSNSKCFLLQYCLAQSIIFFPWYISVTVATTVIRWD